MRTQTLKAWRISRIGATIVVAVGLATWLLPSTPAAASTCGFDAGSGTVTIDVGVSETATIVRSGDAIDVNAAACGTATVMNTGHVDVTTHQSSSVVLDPGTWLESVIRVDLRTVDVLRFRGERTGGAGGPLTVCLDLTGGRG
jgi:hypothetical protein